MWRKFSSSHFAKLRELRPYQPMEILRVRIESLISVGHGAVKLENDWEMRIPTVLPGELVEVKVKKLIDNEKIIEADLVSVLEPSTLRIKPKCQYFGHCSGCQLQHTDINTQREWKRTIVQNYLFSKNILNISVNTVIGTDQIYGYRSKITPTCVLSQNKKKIKVIGYFNRLTREPIDVTHCSVASDLINSRYVDYRQELANYYESSSNSDPTTLRRRNTLRPLLLRESDEPYQYVEVDQSKFVTQTVLGYKFTFSANEFFQINSSLLPLFFQYIIQQARSPSSLPSLSSSSSTSSSSPSYNYLIDTYCGCGVFSILLSPYFREIAGIDIAVQSIRSAKVNKSLNSVRNVNFHHGGADKIFSSVLSFPADETVVIMDPSRKGSDEEFLNQLFKFSPAKVVYVACDVENQVRDCEMMIRNGYEIVDCQPFDMFPQTAHIENIITLERRVMSHKGAHDM
jgi:tRNA/tmRNA/rRNA uracil-C5-methylase (TrmA/RlmC/RlmD family)